ncbi:MAG: hypothetical protein AB1894_04960, partial [Chloroflexota bacterium]
RWHQFFDTIPLTVGHIGWVYLVGHTHNLLNLWPTVKTFQTGSKDISGGKLMKNLARTFVFTSTVLVLLACTSTLPVATPILNSIPTQEPSPSYTNTTTHAASPLPSDTSTQTPTFTLTPSNTPTPTVTPTPTETPIPSFAWSTSFDSLEGGLYNGQLNLHGRYSIVDDPAMSGRGKVLKCEAAPDLAYFDPQYTPGGRSVVRSYPTMYMPARTGPHLIGLDVYLKDDFSPKIRSTSDGPHLSLLGDFYDTGTFGSGWNVAATADLYRMRGKYFIALFNIKDWKSLPLPNAPSFTFNEWHRIEILVTSQREVILFQDGQIVTVGELAPGVPIATAGGHPGLYALSSDSSHEVPFKSGTLYNDNWSIIVWPQ